jgi:CheY-like chemotaxis protein
MMETEVGLAQVLVVEPNPAVRSAILSVLAAERYQAEACDSLGQVLLRTDGRPSVVALVAWQSMDGLLTEEHRHRLVELTRQLKLVLMVPRRWANLLERTDLGSAVAGLIHKPVDADELLGTLQRVLPTPVDA